MGIPKHLIQLLKGLYEDNYRTIALISHTSEILLKIIHKRMESTNERELPDNKAGFRKV